MKTNAQAEILRKKSGKKIVCGIKIAAIMTLSCILGLGLAGCGGDDAQNGKDTLTYWVRLHSNLGTSVTNFGDTPFAKKYQEATGIRIKYTHPAQGQEAENLNLLLASGDLPDIIETDWLLRDPVTCIAQNTIIDLRELIDTSAPNFKEFLNENPDVDRQIKTDEGNYYVFPFVRNGEKLLSTAGLMLRGDWLEELSLEAPETIEEWENVLTQFKEKKGAKIPFVGGSYQLNFFAGAYQVANDFYVDNGQVKYGCIEPGFRDYLETMHRWYEKGLVDKNYAIMDNDLITASMLNGDGGATFGAGGAAMGAYLNAALQNGDTSYTLKAAKFPTIVKGEKPQFGNKMWQYSSTNGAAITGKCKKPEVAARFLDYSYSQEGKALNNFGIEGKSYEMIDGNPTYTALITNNPDGKSMGQILSMYVRATNEGPFVQDERYITQYYQLDEQKDALNMWSDNNGEKHAMPQVTLTKDERSEVNRIMNDLTTFCEENVVSFIIGSKSLSEFDNFVNECKAKNIDRAIAIRQAAYDRFMNRK